MERKLAVIAIGGNSLILDDKPSVPDQYRAVVATVKHIVDVIADGWKVLITHGNGPQVGYLMLRSDMAKRHANLHILPLVNCVADTQGNIGYMIQQAMRNELRRRGLPTRSVTVVSQVEVDARDPKFGDPDKFVGGFYGEAEIDRVRADNPDWILKKDSNRGYRRVVPSPKPVDIVELEAISSLLADDYNVIAGGGGGIPVVRDDSGDYVGVDAVIDKDLTSRLLATKLGADLFVISTGVESVAINFGTPEQETLRTVDVRTMQKHMDDGQFPQGSMGPKVQAALDFIAAGGGEVIITSPENLGKAIREGGGTHVVAETAVPAGCA